MLEALVARKESLQLYIELLWKAGKSCQDHQLEDSARQVLAVACLLLNELDEVEKVLAVQAQGELLERQVELICLSCQQQRQVQLVVTLGSDERGEVESVMCTCGVELAQVQVGINRPQVVQALAVLGGPIATSLVKQELRLAELAQADVTRVEDLPSSQELRTRLATSDSEAIAVLHQQEPAKLSLKEKLARMKQKIQQEADDF